MLDELIVKYRLILGKETKIRNWARVDFCAEVITDLMELKELQEKEKKQVFTPEQEKEIRKYIKEHIDVETTEVVSYGGCEVSTSIRVRNNQRGFY